MRGIHGALLLSLAVHGVALSLPQSRSRPEVLVSPLSVHLAPSIMAAAKPITPLEPAPSPAPQPVPLKPSTARQALPNLLATSAPRATTPTVRGSTEGEERESPPVAPTSTSPATASAVMSSSPVAYQDNPTPPYPPQARRRGMEGMVVIEVDVTADGRVAEAHVQTPSGWALLDQTALDAVRNWRFRPALREGNAVTGKARVPVRFQLKEG